MLKDDFNSDGLINVLLFACSTSVFSYTLVIQPATTHT